MSLVKIDIVHCLQIYITSLSTPMQYKGKFDFELTYWVKLRCLTNKVKPETTVLHNILENVK